MPVPRWPPSPRAWLVAALALLALALLDPGWTGRRDEHDVVAVIDITQSMDVPDMPVAGDPQPASRLARTRALLLQALPLLPCGSRVGLAVFSEYRSLMLLTPVEVCGHYGELKATIAAIDTQMAWSGNSEIAKGLYSAIAAVKTLPTKPAIAFFTDGQEAPPIDPRFRPAWNGQRGEVHGVLVGVGGDVPTAIPRHDPEGHAMGTWGAGDVVQRSQRSGAGADAAPGATGAQALPPSLPGATPGREHLSAVREPYLQMLASETAFGYHRLTDAPGLAAALLAPELAHPVDARVSLRMPATLAALLALLGLYGRAPAQRLQARWRVRARGPGPVTAAPTPGT